MGKLIDDWWMILLAKSFEIKMICVGKSVGEVVNYLL